MNFHPQIIEKEGKKEFVILPYSEFIAMQEALEDYQDLMDLREAKAELKDEDTIRFDNIRDELISD